MAWCSVRGSTGITLPFAFFRKNVCVIVNYFLYVFLRVSTWYLILFWLLRHFYVLILILCRWIHVLVMFFFCLSLIFHSKCERSGSALKLLPVECAAFTVKSVSARWCRAPLTPTKQSRTHSALRSPLSRQLFESVHFLKSQFSPFIFTCYLFHPLPASRVFTSSVCHWYRHCAFNK
jgi:hypothetical protein